MVLSDCGVPETGKTVVGTPTVSAPGGLPDLRSESQEIMTHVICDPQVPWQPSGGPQTCSGNEKRLPGEGDVCTKPVDE